MLDCLFLLFVFPGFRHVNLVKIGRIPYFPSIQYLEDGSEDHPGDRNDGTFLAAAFHDAFIFGLVVRRLVGFHGCMGNLYQCRFEVDAGTCDSDRFLLTS